MKESISRRPFDVVPIEGERVVITVNGKPLEACKGETVLSTLLAHGRRAICKNDHGLMTGAYCGMGICFSCGVFIDGTRVRACQVTVREGMSVQTCFNSADQFALGIQLGAETDRP